MPLSIAPSVAAVRSTTNGTLHFIGALVLCALVPFLLTTSSSVPEAGRMDGSITLQWLIVAYGGWRLVQLFALGKPHPMATIFWLYVYVWLGLAGLVQVVRKTAPWPISISPESTFRAQLLILVGVVCVDVGSRLSRRDELGVRSLSGEREIAPKRLLLLAAFVVASSPLWLRELGGISTLFTSREALSTRAFGSYGASTTEGGVKIALATVPTFVALLGMIITRRESRAWRRYTWLLLILVVVNLVLNSPISMPRFWTATMLSALVFVSPLVRRPAVYRGLVAGLLLVGIVLFPYAAYFRYNAGFTTVGPVASTLATKADYDSFQMVAATVQSVHDRGIEGGRQLLGDVGFFVPRSIWKDKPVNTGELLAKRAGMSYTNLSAPMWGEAYIDFGWPGAVLVLLGYGYVMRRLDDRFLTVGGSGMLLAVPLVAGYSAILLRGSMLQAMGRLAVMLVLIALLTRVRRPSLASGSPADGGGAHFRNETDVTKTPHSKTPDLQAG